MVLTPLAEELSLSVRDALSAIDSVLKKDAAFDPVTANRRFRIMLSDYAAMVLMTTALPRLQLQAHRIRLELLSNAELPDHAIARDEIDLLLIARQFAPADEPFEELFSDDYSCVSGRRIRVAETRLRSISIWRWDMWWRALGAPSKCLQTSNSSRKWAFTSVLSW